MRREGRRAVLGTLLFAAALALGLALLDFRRILWHLPPEWRPPGQRGFVWHYENTMFPDTTPAEMGDGGPARGVRFQDPMGIGEDAAGNVYVADRGHYVWRIDPQGRAEVVAGTGRQGGAPESRDALRSDLGIPEGLCVDGRGRVYFADSRNNLVLRLDPDAALVRVAGTGRRGFAGDGGPANEAQLNRPFDVRLDSHGNLYVADYGNHRIRRIDAEGRIETAAGTGEPGYSGDGGPATSARLNEPYGVFLDPGDRLLIADSANHVVRIVGEDGVIHTLAGKGERGYAGDGGPARDARFDSPQSLFVAAGRILVNDEHNHAVRAIGPDGRIATLLGDGTPGTGGDGGPAARARLNDPENVLVRADGSILVTDGDARRVRIIDPDGRVRTFAGVPAGPAP